MAMQPTGKKPNFTSGKWKSNAGDRPASPPPARPAARPAEVPPPRPAAKSLAERLPTMTDSQLLALQANATRVSQVEADRNYLVVHATDGRRFRLRGTVERIQARLDPARFARVNRSTLVRLAAVREVRPWPDGEYRLLLEDGGRVTWTKRYLEQAAARLLLRL